MTPFWRNNDVIIAWCVCWDRARYKTTDLPTRVCAIQGYSMNGSTTVYEYGLARTEWVKQQRFVILKNRGAFSTLVWRHHTCTDVEVLPGTHHCHGARYLTTYMRECKRQRTILPENWHYFCFFYHQKNVVENTLSCNMRYVFTAQKCTFVEI